MVRLIVFICVFLPGLRLFAGPLHLALPEWPASNWTDTWYGPDHFGTERARVASQIENLPGRQLVIVRYSTRHNPLNEWVYNAPDIDDSKVVWARDMDTAHNLELMRHYPTRQVWLVEPDSLPATVLPYAATLDTATGSR